MAARATNQASDKQQAVVMLEETIAVPKEVSADAGYYSAKTVDDLHGRGVAPFIALEQTRYGRVVLPAPRGRIPSHLSPKDRMRRKLRTRRGRQRYALRMQTVEPVFGQIKQGRGSRQFLLRGLEKVQGEWSLICTVHTTLNQVQGRICSSCSGSVFQPIPVVGRLESVKSSYSIGGPWSTRSRIPPTPKAS